MSDYSVEGEWDGFIFRYLQPEDHPKMLELIIEHLAPCMSIVGYTKKQADDWSLIFKEMFCDKNRLHFLAVDKESGEIAGFRIIGTAKVGVPEPMPAFEHKETKDIFQAMVDMGIESRIEDHTTSEYLADFFGTCVLPQYRQRGLCTELYRRAIKLCKSRGFNVAKVSFASPFSRKAAYKLGYKELTRRLCIDFKDENGVPLKPDTDPRWYIDMGIFEF